MSWTVISELGRPLWLGILSALIVILLSIRHRRAATLWAVGMGGAVTIPFVLKAIFDTARPEGSLVNTVGAGFPSAHAFAATVFVALCIMTFTTRISHRVPRAVFVAILALFAAAVGISRIALKAHMIIDVVGGYLLGLAWWWVAVRFTRRIGPMRD